MGTIRTASDMVYPEPGTKVIFRKSGSGLFYASNIRDGDEVYVCTYAPSSRAIVVNKEPGEHYGNFCSEWEEIEEPVLDSLTDKQKTELYNLALAAAKKRGYCGETKNILSDLGLTPMVAKTLKVVVPQDAKIEVYVDGMVVDHKDVKDED